MIKFFRRIRQNLLFKNNFSKYFLYAIGEIILVVIGILIALQINTWNENKKLHSIEKQSYENLLSSLRKDSLELINIFDYQTKSLHAQNRFINTDVSELINTPSLDSMNRMLFDIYKGAYSFFPKYGTYNSIASSKGLDIIKSETIKSNLIDLYDYECSRYEFVDKALDEKYMNEFYPFLQKELGFFVDSNLEHNEIDIPVIESNYNALQLECQNLNPMSSNSFNLLKSIQNKVNHLIGEIDDEVRKSH